MKINIIRALPIGVGLDQISGKVTKAYAQKSGTGEFGDWTLQGIELTDDTGSINCQIKNHPPIEKGIDITIKGHINSKKELKGITLGEYKGEKQVSVTKSATIGGIGTDTKTEGKVPSTPVSLPNSPIVDNSARPVDNSAKPDWDAKERRMVRMCAWKCASQMFTGMATNEHCIFDNLQHFARQIEADIYREVKKSEIPFGEDK